jgi:hypothetical protein
MNTASLIEFLQKISGVLAGISVATFILSLLLIPIIVTRLEPHCFVSLLAPQSNKKAWTAGSLLLGTVKNFIGIILIIAGIAMLVLPGQGILTIVIGLFLLSIPGKRKLLSLLINRQEVRKSLDWIRRKQGKPAFIWPD